MPNGRYAAVGPTKLGYAWKVAENLQGRNAAGSATFFCPGKSYPGEVNPAMGLAYSRESRRDTLLQLPSLARRSKEGGVRLLAEGIRKRLQHFRRIGCGSADPRDPRAEILAMPIDYDDDRMAFRAPGLFQRISAFWWKRKDLPGLRLPLNPAASVDTTPGPLHWKGEAVGLFVPPLLQKPLSGIACGGGRRCLTNRYRLLAFEGYTPR